MKAKSISTKDGRISATYENGKGIEWSIGII
jgi:hypothetical protein